MITRKRGRTVLTFAAMAMAILVLTMTSATRADVVLKVDFNSNQDSGGDSTAAGDPGQSAANNHQEGWSSYHANHEVAAEFSTADYDGITITPDWPNTTDNRAQQSIDRGAGNDGNWDDAEGDINLVTDWIGIDTRTGNGGNGDWDGSTGTPTYITLTLSGLIGGAYDWTSFHHDTEHCHGPFAVWLSTDGGATFDQLDDGIMTDSTAGGTPDSGATEGGPDAYTLPSAYHASFIANGTDDVVLRFAPYSSPGVHRQIWGMNGFVLELASSDQAFAPTPADGASDVATSVVLSWSSADGTAAMNGHKIFLSNDLANVSNGLADAEVGVVSNPEFDTALLPVVLDYGTPYYWRVDQASTPGGPWTDGPVWSFTVEPVAIPIEQITATASGANPNMGPEKTIDGSGLNELNQHVNAPTDMWLTQTDGSWIQYEFDKAYKLHEMVIWNSNQVIETFIGFGVKEASVETSLDGENWTAVNGVTTLARATGVNTYEANNAIALGGVTAKYVTLSVNSAYGTTGQSGLSEVRFLAIPVTAREPLPANGAVLDSMDITLQWRAGRDAASHDVYLSTDEQAVVNGSATANSVEDAQLAAGALLDLGQTYFWKVNEINAAETPAEWAGEVWSFSTPASLIVEDFESYSGKEGKEVFMTWLDGFGGDPSLGGSITGHIDGPFVETVIVQDGVKSLPIYVNNEGGFADIDGNSGSPSFSEVMREFDEPQDWTQHGVKALTLWFHGDSANTAMQMYIKINGTRIVYNGDTLALQRKPWHLWYVDLSQVAAATLGRVTDLSIGFEGGQGVVYVDSIALSPRDRQQIMPADPGTANLMAHYAFDGNTDDTTGVHTLIAEGVPAYVAGMEGQALKLNGVSDFVSIETNIELPTYTAALWFRVEGGTGNRDIMSLYDAAGGFGTLLEITDTGEIRYLHRFPLGNSGGNSVFSGSGYDDGAWYHAAAVKTETSMTLFINGQAIGTVADDSQYEALQRITLGVLKHDNLQRYFPGEMDDVVLYNRALSGAEVAFLAGYTDPIDTE
jgi:hypothetical protein